jgi:lipoyl(octanoyl) transferase
MKQKRNVHLKDLGLIGYHEAFIMQSIIFNDIVNKKIEVRDTSSIEDELTNHFLLCEHPHVITLGKSGDQGNLLFNEALLRSRGVEFFRTNRGGDITYHGPGQIVGYPILDLEQFHLTIHEYVFSLEEIIITTLKHFGFESGRLKGMTGVWLEPDHPVKARKICAIGVKASRHITMHGFAFNISTNLDYFNLIVPCGISGKSVTSLRNELGREITINEVKPVLFKSFEEVFSACLIFET